LRTGAIADHRMGPIMFDYLARQPEHLVLHGYRCWTRGAATASRVPWIEAEDLYMNALGERSGRAALDALADFVGTTGLCARCPLRMLRPGARALCRDEALVLGLISALQNGDDAASGFCVAALADDRVAGHVEATAATYAVILKSSGSRLLPVPLEILRGVTRDAAAADMAPAPAGTLLN
jgi:hypothetical protein